MAQLNYRQERRAKVYSIEIGNMYEPTSPSSPEEDLFTKIDSLKILRQQNVDLRRGDIVNLTRFGKLASVDDQFIFDGVKIERSWGEPDDYDGVMVPPEFMVITEFPVQYWKDALVPPVVWLHDHIVNFVKNLPV